VSANKLASESNIETNVFYIVAGGNTTINLLIEEIKKLLNSDLEAVYGPFRKGDIPHSFANIEKAKSLLNYNPSVNILQGLEKTVDWYLANQEWLNHVTSGAYQSYYQNMYS
jgi:UDP-N-acetylglucosamine 4-epimerase